jgi:hypothetical protein
MAQMDTAAIAGYVVDASGATVEGATVELLDIAHGRNTNARTNKSGLYIFPNVHPGRYTLQVSAAGFRTIQLMSLAVNTQDELQRNFRLEPGPESSVTLMASSARVQNSGAVSTVVDQRLVQELPLNGRSFQTLFQLTPGVVITPTTFASQGQFSVNGQRTNTNYFIIDGVSANVGIAAGVDPGQSAGGSLPALSAFGGTNSLVSTGAVQEFAISTSSYAPEFGRMPGAQVSIVTRSGSNELHGEVFDYIRNDAFDANDWFANRDNLKRAALRQNDYGAVLGGPILRSKTFFFISYEGMRLLQPTSTESDVPSVTSRNDAPTLIKPFLNAYPLPNGPDHGNGLAEAIYGFSNPSSLDTIGVRIDHHIGERLAVFGRYDFSTSAREQRGAGINSLSTVTDTRFGLQTFTAGVSYRASPVLINDLRFNWSRSVAAGQDELDSFGGAVPLQSEIVFPPPFSAENSLFQFAPAANARNRQITFGRDVSNLQMQLNFIDSLSYQLTNHVLKAGLDFRTSLPRTAPSLYVQQTEFADIQSALSLKSEFTVVGANLPVHSSYKNYSVYAQDGWKASRRLSATYGVRWDYNPAPVGRAANGNQPFAIENINKLPALSLAAPGTPIYRATRNDFAPRLGLVWGMRRSPGTESIIRAGAGMFYDLANGPAGNVFDGTTFPFSAVKLLLGAPFPIDQVDASPPSIPGPPPFAKAVAFPSVLKAPYSWQWNVALQQSLGAGQTLNVSYVGSSGHNLLRTEEYLGGVASVPDAFTQILFTNNGGYSNYNALQLQFIRRPSAGADIIASYCLSHSFDNVSTDSNFAGIPGQFVIPRLDYASSDFDIRHTATLGVDYTPKFDIHWHTLNTLLNNWTVDSIAMIHSSPPVDVTVSRDIGFGVYDFRPDLLPGIPMYVDDQSAPGGRRFNPSALSVPVALQQGSLDRNAFRGFPLFQLDLALQRKLRVKERTIIMVRVEAFNLFNHPNFSPPSAQMGSLDSNGNLIPQSEFGISQRTLAQGLAGGQGGGLGSGFSPLYQIGGARSLQLALKVAF